MPTTTTLLLLRHGETEANAAGVLQGQSESRLTARGRSQAAALGAALAQRLHGSDGLTPIVYASDLSRASDTAQAVADALGGESRVATDPRLRERRLGPFQGIPTVDCARKFPRTWAAFNSGALDHGTPPKNLDKGADANGGVESSDEMRERCKAALEEIRLNHLGKTTLAVSHGGMIHTACMCYLDPKQELMIPHIGNCTVTTLIADSDGGMWRVASVGEVIVQEEGGGGPQVNVDLRPHHMLQAVPNRIP